MPLEVLRQRMAAYTNRIKRAPRGRGEEEILLPGERAYRSYEACLLGGIPVEDDARADLSAAAQQFGVSLTLQHLDSHRRVPGHQAIPSLSERSSDGIAEDVRMNRKPGAVTKKFRGRETE